MMMMIESEKGRVVESSPAKQLSKAAGVENEQRHTSQRNHFDPFRLYQIQLRYVTVKSFNSGCVCPDI